MSIISLLISALVIVVITRIVREIFYRTNNKRAQYGYKPLLYPLDSNYIHVWIIIFYTIFVGISAGFLSGLLFLIFSFILHGIIGVYIWPLPPKR